MKAAPLGFARGWMLAAAVAITAVTGAGAGVLVTAGREPPVLVRAAEASAGAARHRLEIRRLQGDLERLQARMGELDRAHARRGG